MALSNILRYWQLSWGRRAKMAALRYFFRRSRVRLGLGTTSERETGYLNLQGQHFYFGLKSTEIGSYQEIFLDQIYEQHAEFLPQPGWTILDIGANIGLFALRYANRVQHGRIVSLEPNPYVFPLLVKNIEVNQLKNVQAFATAIGGNSGKSPFQFHRFSTGSGSIIKWRFPEEKNVDLVTVEVQVRTLDDFIEEQTEVKSIELIKMDVEGAELNALLGAAKILKNTHRIVMEYHSPALLKKIKEYLQPYGFQLKLELPPPVQVVYFAK